MAAKGKRASKTNVYWSKDPDNEDERIVKVHMPGVILEPHSNVKNPMVRKPVHMIKPRVVTLQKSLRNSLEKRRQELSRSDTSTSPSKDVTASLLTYGEGHFGGSHQGGKDKSKKEVTLKELNPQDKKRVANLVKELAKVGEEREHAEERLKEERLAFEERLVILQEEYDAVIKEKIYLQKRFVELQSLLVKYQTNGRTPSPRKAVKSPVPSILSSVSPSKPVCFSPSKPTLTQIPGNTRPGLTGASSDKLNDSVSQAGFSQQGTGGSTVPLNNRNTKDLMDANLHPAPLHNNSLTVGDVKESFPEIMGSSQDGTSIGTLPAATSSKVEVSSPQRQILEIPQSSSQKEGLCHKSLDPSEPSANTTSAVSSHHHGPAAVNSQPALQPGSEALPQFPPPQAKPVFSVFGDGVIPPRKNEDRSFSEVSGVSGSFSAELDAVYRLYCREYELQLQLQQQQIELQKQQLQLQQQLQQVETLQQQQQQQQQQGQQQQQQQHHQQQQQQQPLAQRHQPMNHASLASQAAPAATHGKHLTTVIDEMPAPSPVPRPSSQPRQVSPARSLIPTPEDGYRLPGAGVQHNMSTAGAYVIREDRSAGAEMSGNTNHRNVNNRMELGKENKDPLVPVPPDRVLSAPPSFSHPRSNFKHRQVPRPQDESQTPADHSYQGRAVPRYERHPMDDNPQNTQQHADGRSSADYRAGHPSSSRYSLHSRGHDVSANRKMMALRERHVGQNEFSGRGSRSLFHPRSNYEINSERSSFAAESFQTDSILSGTRRTKPQSSFHEPHTSYSQNQGVFKRQTAGSDQRFSLYSNFERESQSRDHQMLPGGDDVMDFRHRRLEQSVERAPVDNAYPLSLVDIVEDLEDKTGQQEDYLCPNAGLAGGLDTTDSGYSQDTLKERSPLTSENVNSDEEEAAVLGDIFFLSGRV